MRLGRHIWMLITWLSASVVCVFGREADSKLPDYVPATGISGNLDSVGSDSLNNLMTLWAQAFQEFYPNVHVQIEGKGSSTAPPALIEATAQLGPMSREMKPTELDKFENRFQYKPTQIPVAIDALGVYVHKDNPTRKLTLTELDGIFSNTLRRGGISIETWGTLGLKGSWARHGISVYGRNSASGTYGFFKEIALEKGDYKPSVKEQPGSSAVVQGISGDLYGIGYSGIGYMTSGVRAIAIGESSEHFFEPTYENCLNQEYPLARFLYIYVNKSPVKPLDDLTLEFLRFVLSRQGQEIVVKDGYFPLPAEFFEEIIPMIE